MFSQIWTFLVTATITVAVPTSELLPASFLKPRDFNYHPYTDVGIPAALKKVQKTPDPYVVLEKLRQREDRQYSPQNIVIYPTPHPSVFSKKQIESNEISKYDDPYADLPKNYAFTYTVKDQASGDDFSHSQAHNGKSTRGQYRVKLPDGRTQIVSYTADHKGYRADVQYEEKEGIREPLIHSSQNVPSIPIKLPENYPDAYQRFQTKFYEKNTPIVTAIQRSAAIRTPVLNDKLESNYITNPSTVAPVQYEYKKEQILVNTQDEVEAVTPHYYFAKTSSPFEQQQSFVTPTVAPQYVPHYVSSAPIHSGEHNSVQPFYNSHKNYQAVSTTVSPQQYPIIVTPRSVYPQRVAKPQQTAMRYRLVYQTEK